MAVKRAEDVRSMKAAADLSGSQFRAMKITAEDTVNVVTATTDTVYGILQNKPDAADKAAELDFRGITKWEAGAAVTLGAAVHTDTSGRCVDAGAAGTKGSGIALQAAAAAGEIISVDLTPNVTV